MLSVSGFCDFVIALYIYVQSQKSIRISEGLPSHWEGFFVLEAEISREVVKRVNFITATRRTDKNEFNGKRYIKIEVDGSTK